MALNLPATHSKNEGDRNHTGSPSFVLPIQELCSTLLCCSDARTFLTRTSHLFATNAGQPAPLLPGMAPATANRFAHPNRAVLRDRTHLIPALLHTGPCCLTCARKPTRFTRGRSRCLLLYPQRE
jgi:hypothetical protein